MTIESDHGKSCISVDGDIISVLAVGAYNEEGIMLIIEELESIINSFNQDKFKLLFDFSQVEGGTPDVYIKINECNIWLNGQNMVAKALVINSDVQLAILDSRSPARSLQNSKNFEDKSSAINWLHSQS
ncbi:MAG: hypothetical protein GY951_03335 [Psychromonas sp.]|nr:hypothetical protein [Alteromonadales bacterium]MCP5077072.1 hypothetical protein [Psychromonas sp.]